MMILRMTTVLALSLIFAAEVSAQNSNVNKETMLRLVNTTRKNGCKCGPKWYAAASPLVWNEQLEKAAFVHTKEMADKNYFSHIGTDGSDPSARMEKQGYKWMNYGENIGLGYTSESEAVEAWLKSPGHCKNIMNPATKELGAARVNNYWTQVFGSR